MIDFGGYFLPEPAIQINSPKVFLILWEKFLKMHVKEFNILVWK